MSWINPFTGWHPSNIEGITGADLNRIEGNIDYLENYTFDITGSISYMGSYVDGFNKLAVGSEVLEVTTGGLLVQSTVRNLFAGSKLYLSRHALMFANSGVRLRVIGKTIVDAVEVVKTWDSTFNQEEADANFILADNTMATGAKCLVYIYMRPNSGTSLTVTLGDSWRLRMFEDRP